MSSNIVLSELKESFRRNWACFLCERIRQGRSAISSLLNTTILFRQMLSPRSFVRGYTGVLREVACGRNRSVRWARALQQTQYAQHTNLSAVPSCRRLPWLGPPVCARSRMSDMASTGMPRESGCPNGPRPRDEVTATIVDSSGAPPETVGPATARTA